MAQSLGAVGRRIARAQEVITPFYDPADPSSALTCQNDAFSLAREEWFAGVPNTNIYPHSAICQLNMSAQMPPLLQDSGVPFDLFIQALTEQLDKAQAAMAIKARVGKLPLTFAVKDVSIDLRAFVQMVDDDVYLRPAGPGEGEASTIKLALTTITKSMVEENAIDFKAEDPKFNLKEALGDQLSDDDQRRLERIGVRTVTQLNDLKTTAGADVIARLSRMPVNRLQQALMRAAAPRVTRVDQADESNAGSRVHELDELRRLVRQCVR